MSFDVYWFICVIVVGVICFHAGRNLLRIGGENMNLGNFRYDRNLKPYGMKKCKYHCDYSDGEYCHYKEEDGCIYNKVRRLTDAESMGMLFDDAPEIPEGVIPEVRHK